jgi:hypothetical protein
MRQHWQEPGATTAAARSIITSHFETNGFAPATADEWLSASEVAWTMGIHIGPPVTPVHNEIARLTKLGDPIGAAAVRAKSAQAWSTENTAINRWTVIESTWMKLPTPKELAAANKARSDAAEREQQIQARTLEIVEADDKAARDKRITAARRQAEKEIGV